MESPHSDHHLYIEGIRRQDHKVYENIYTNFQGDIINWIKRNSGSTEDGLDVFQEAIIIIIKKSESKDFVLTSPFNAYLKGIVRFLWLKTLRKRKIATQSVRELDLPASTDKASYEQLLESTLDGDRWLQLLHRSFQQLSDRCQQLLGMEMNGKTTQEITNLLQTNANAFYKSKSDCKKKWRKLMEQDSDFKQYNPFGL